MLKSTLVNAVAVDKNFTNITTQVITDRTNNHVTFLVDKERCRV
ncbi:Uncharacterised protein [Vibrio cholerae]|nr:Uncharacterised protein [Vibrio cholerae]